MLSGLFSSQGASRQLLKIARKRGIHGVVSRTIIKEALAHAEKLQLTQDIILQEVTAVFEIVTPAPSIDNETTYRSLLEDPNDAHLLATAKETDSHYLVTLDRRHLLKQASNIKIVAILSPAELLKELKQ